MEEVKHIGDRWSREPIGRLNSCDQCCKPVMKEVGECALVFRIFVDVGMRGLSFRVRKVAGLRIDASQRRIEVGMCDSSRLAQRLGSRCSPQ
jgi:hypothetical protein